MTKHEYLCAIADVVKSKSDCFKRKVGAVFVNTDYEILATGYNAPPRGFNHCDAKTGSMGYQPGTCGSPCTRNIHAEINAICQAAKRGTALRDSILYCSYAPCVDCARALINVGVKEVRVKELNIDGGWNVLQHAEIPVTLWGETV